MRIARLRTEDGSVQVGRIEGEGDAQAFVPLLDEPRNPSRDALIELLHDEGIDAIATAEPIGPARPFAPEALASPVRRPGKILAIGLNYKDHAAEAGIDVPEAPLLFAKYPNTVTGPYDDVVYAASTSSEVDYEAELGVVIGRRAKSVSEEDALSYVLGYTACNDVSARDAQFAHTQWVRGKSFDTFCPLGPWLVTADEIPDPQQLRLATRVNGRELQEGTTANMIFPVAELISYLSRVITLEPGDVIASGTPHGVGFVRTPPVYLGDGDVVEVEVERIGLLRNRVVVE